MKNQSAIEVLGDIRAAAFANAAPLPLKESVQAQWQGIGFQVGGLRLVSPIGEISEILQPPRYASLPSVKSWVLGIANVRGRLLPIIDLHEYFGLTPTLPQVQWRVLVVEQEDIVAGFLVEQSLGIQHFVEESFEEAQIDGAASLAEYVGGAFRQGGRVFYETQLKLILKDEKFFDVSEKDPILSA